MTYKEFNGDESGFDEWVRLNPFGVVINSRPGKINIKYIKAHQPNCSSFQKHSGSKTVYSKHCFDSAEEAIQDFARRGIPKPDFTCTTCKVSALESTGDGERFKKSVQTLLKKSFNSPPVGNPVPERISATATTLFKRDPAVVAWVIKIANGVCELCQTSAPFLTDGNRPYLEVHHVITLASGGADTVNNAVALCPNCHRAMHFSQDRNALTEKLYTQGTRLIR